MSANFDDLIAQRALSTATPGTLPLVRRSAYLADALRSMTDDGSKANYASAWALPARLLGEALMERASDRANNQLATAQTADQQSLLSSARAGLGPAPSTVDPVPGPGAATPSAPGPSPQTAQAQPFNTPTFAAAETPPAGANPTAWALDPAVVRTIAKEAGGEGPDGWKGVGSVILNRMKASGQSGADVVHAPHQFAGEANLDPSSPQFQRIAAAVGPMFSGQQPPTTDADHFWAPSGMPGGRPPTWAQGATPQTIGHQQFVHIGYGAGPQMAAAPSPPPPVQPYQVASIGPTPPPPSNAVGAPPQPQPAPPAQSPPAGGANPMATSPPGPSLQTSPQGPPTGLPATPQERALFERLAADPRTMQQAVALSQSIAQRQASPLEAPKGFMWGQDGRAHAIPGTETQATRLGDGSYLNRDATGAVSFAQAPETFTATPGPAPYTVMNTSSRGKVDFAEAPGGRVQGPGGGQQFWNPATGGYQNATQPAAWSAPHPMAGAEGLYQDNTATGEVRKAADAPYSVKDAGTALQDLYKDPTLEKMQKTGEMYRSLVSASQRPGGMPDAELIDNAAQLFSGGVARQFNQKMLENAQGPLARLKQFAPMIVSGQRLSPEARQAVITAAHDYASEADQAFRQRASSISGFTGAQGQSIAPYIAPFRNDLPNVPNLSSIPNGMPGVQGQGGQQPPAPGRPGGAPVAGPGAGASRDALLAEARRRGLIR